jgi:hypothetical protein
VAVAARRITTCPYPALGSQYSPHSAVPLEKNPAMDVNLTVYLDDWSDFVPSSVFLIEIILRSLFVATPKIK